MNSWQKYFPNLASSKNVQVIIPWLPHRSRTKGFEWVLEWYWSRFGEPYVSEAPHNEAFNKAKAINRAAEQFPDSVLIIGDADCCTPDPALFEGVRRAFEQPEKLWLPHTSFKPMLQEQAEWFLATRDPAFSVSGKLFPRRSQKRLCPGGIWIADAALFLKYKANESFYGWGSEDSELMRRIPHERVGGPLFHIWHPKASRKYARRNRQIARRSWLANLQEKKPDEDS